MSPRQRQVLDLIADGLTDRQIADRIHVSAVTVYRHVEDLRRRLGATNRAHAVAIAFHTGVLRPRTRQPT